MAEDKSPFWIVTTFFPYSIGFIIFLSAARLFMIYKEFGLPIFNYLEATDLTIEVANDLYGLFWFFLVSLVLLFVKDLIKKIIGIRGRNLSIGGCLILFATSGYLYWGKHITSFTAHFITCWLLYAGLCMGGFTIKCIQKRPPKWLNFVNSISTKSLLFGTVLLFSFFFCKTLAAYLTYEIKVKHSTIGTTIKFRDKTKITSDSSLYYIHNTTKYIFLFNANTKNSVVFPMEIVESVESTPDLRHKK